MHKAIGWTSIGLRLLVVGMVMLGVGFDGHWVSGSVARKAPEARGGTVMIEENPDGVSTWPSLIRAEQVHLAVCDRSWIKGAVVRKAREALGRTVVIEGNLEADWTWPPRIRAEQVR